MLSSCHQTLDYGDTARASSHTQEFIAPLLLNQLIQESFFGESIGLPADVWAFGCTVFDIFANGPYL